MNTVYDIREYFIQELEAERFCTDRNGGKTIEMLGACFLADKESIFGKVNHEYVDAEIEWYQSMSTNINRLSEIYGRSPVAWQYSANEYGEINSNYGYLIYSDKFYNQYDNALEELIHNPDSRRASMIYNRPSVWTDFDDDGKNDFICTNAVTYYIRDGKLNCVVQMRSNDVVFGYKNDYAWQKFVLDQLVDDLNKSTDMIFEDSIEPGDIFWQVQNLHVYEKHFDLVK